MIVTICYYFSPMFSRLICLVLLLALPVMAETADVQAKLKAIQQELKESRTKLKETKQQQQVVLGKLVKINIDLRYANRKLKLAKDKIEVNKTKIGQLSVELRRTEEDLEEKAGLLERRIKEAYKSTGTNYLDLIFASRSMSDFLNRFYFFEKVIEQDTQLIKGIKSDLKETKVKREVLTDRTREIKELASVIAEEKKKIASEAEAKKQVVEQLKHREKEYESKIAELERSSQELEVLIRRKMAERSKAGLVAHGSGVISWPLQGRITSRYGVYRRRGYRHTGIDIAAPHGSPIYSADSGEVIFSGWWDGYGKALVIDHGKGTATVYAHMSRIYLQVGAVVAKGQTIGLVGSTGYSTGPHLHFEVRRNGTPVNPMKFLP